MQRPFTAPKWSVALVTNIDATGQKETFALPLCHRFVQPST